MQIYSQAVILEYLKVNGLFPSVQSAYRKCHSTETAMARDPRVLSDDRHPHGT